MPDERLTSLFFELFTGLPRQGPGDEGSTRRALALVPPLGPEGRVLDIGCGTGLQTRVLARSTPAHITAIDSHAPFVDELRREAARLGLRDRIDARVGDMRHVEAPPHGFDVVWCEGAIAIMGVDAALREWRALLAPGGHLAFTEVCWTKPDPPADCAAFWAAEYPAIGEPAALAATAADGGYETVGHFTLPRSAWWDDYYRPLQANVTAFRDRHRGEPDAEGLADGVQREIDVWHSYGDFYSYEFFVLRPR